MVSELSQTLYAGISKLKFDGDPFDLGHGITVRSTYAHLFAVNMMAFTRASDGKPHPGPWRAARGGFGYDIEIELAVKSNGDLPGGLSPDDAVLLIATLLRIDKYPYLMVPVLSDLPFDLEVVTGQEPILRPFETEPRIFQAPASSEASIRPEDLLWVRSVWPKTAEMVRASVPFSMALRAVDLCGVRGRRSSALLSAWGALEELFLSSRSELRFRVAANVASYLEEPGQKRLDLFKKLTSLYNYRSKAAHTARDAEPEPLLQSLLLLRNSVVKMISEEKVPTQADFERLLFCGSAE